jgi:hypothetical protein
MASGRLSPDRKLDLRLRDDRNFPFHNSFSLILLGVETRE